MAQTLYTCQSAAAVALVAATAKSIIGVNGATDFGIDLKKFRVAFDGVTAANTPVLVELCTATFATNAPGTNSTSNTPVAVAGRANAATGFTAAYAWTAEPTVLVPIDSVLLTPNGGTLVYDWQDVGDTPDSALATGFVLRVTAPQVVNARAALWFGRC